MVVRPNMYMYVSVLKTSFYYIILHGKVLMPHFQTSVPCFLLSLQVIVLLMIDVRIGQYVIS